MSRTILGMTDKIFMKVGTDEEFGIDNHFKSFIAYVIIAIIFTAKTVFEPSNDPALGTIINFFTLLTAYYTISVTYWNIRLNKKIKPIQATTPTQPTSKQPSTKQPVKCEEVNTQVKQPQS